LINININNNKKKGNKEKMEEKKLCQCNHEGRKSFWGLFFRLFEIEDELSNWAYVIV